MARLAKDQEKDRKKDQCIKGQVQIMHALLAVRAGQEWKHFTEDIIRM
jgi:hypothetical protein